MREIGLEAAETCFDVSTGGTRCGESLPVLSLPYCKERLGGGGDGVLRLDDRTLHVFAGGFLGTGLGGASYQGEKPAAAIARLGWIRLDKYMVPAVLNLCLDKPFII